MRASKLKTVDKKSTKVDKKSTKVLARLLGSKSRAQILTWFFSHPSERFYVRQLNSLLNIDLGLLSRELRKLETIGILRSKKSGREKIYDLNRDSPIFNELKGLVAKTEGVIGMLRDALQKFKAVKVALIYGSFAQGKENAESDIDLLVVGGEGIKLPRVHSILSKIEEDIGREINLTYFTTKEFRKRIKKDLFIRDVLRNPCVMIIGNLDECQ